LSIQSEKWRSGVVMFLNVKFCYEIQHFWFTSFKFNWNIMEIFKIWMDWI